MRCWVPAHGAVETGRGVDVSQSYVEAATDLSRTLGFQDATQYHMGNFVDLEADIPSADIVILDRVICCYPDMEELVTASTRHTQRLYVLTYPRRTWWMRVGAWAFNFGLTAMRREFRFFLHHPKDTRAMIEAAQFSLIHSAMHGPWEIAAYRRNQATFRLLTVTDPVIIDGYTQPDPSPNTYPPGPSDSRR